MPERRYPKKKTTKKTRRERLFRFDLALDDELFAWATLEKISMNELVSRLLAEALAARHPPEA